MDAPSVDEIEDSAEKPVEKLEDSTEDVEEFYELFVNADHPVREWIIMTGERRKVVGTIMLSVFVLFLGLGVARPVDLARLLRQTNTIQTLFNTYLSGVILLISIVVSVNSIVVSQQLATIGSSQQRIQQAVDFREQTDDLIEDGDVSPADPAKFLETLITAVEEKSQRLLETSDGDELDDDDAKEALEQQKEFVEQVDQSTDKVKAGLKEARYEPFEVFSAGLSYNHSRHLDMTYRMRRKYADVLSESTQDAYDELLDTIQLVAASLEYFKTLYFQEEFANLSRDLLYSGLPTVLVISYVLLWFDSRTFGNVSLLGLEAKFLFFIGTFTVALVPFIVLTAYVLRAAAVAKRTLAAGPFRFEQ